MTNDSRRSLARRLHGAALLLMAGFTIAAVLPATSGAASKSKKVKSEPPAAAAASAPSTAPWVQRSNENAMVLLKVMAQFTPEQAGMWGLPGVDDRTLDLGPNVDERSNAAIQEAIAQLEKNRAAERDPAVQQDLDILIDRAKQQIQGTELDKRLMVPYFNVAGTVFRGLQILLDDQVAPERRSAALVRLRRYTGLEPGTTPLAKLAEDRTRERLAQPGLAGPVKAEIEKDLAQEPLLIDGIGKLFAKFQIAGYEKPYAELKKQLEGYDAFVRAEVLTRARADFRLPPEMYAFSLKEYGVDMPVEELTSRARVTFREIQNEMQAIAPLVAREKGLTATDYREVLRGLKQQQLVGEAILPHYQARVKDLEARIVSEHIVTLPQRPMRIELASDAETAQQPAAHMRPPRLIGNTGERGTFVLPLRNPGSGTYDDFTFEAASWTLTAHEGRPGHELQFASMVEKGVSLARALFAFNSVNVEGWALYAEAEMKPYEPLDGQLVALQHRLLRAARAILDPGLQSGVITPEEATRVLQQDVVESPAMAAQEVERYTFRAPGQATSYFCGYQRLMELRTDVERALGSRFDRQKYHDFVLAQGLVPPSLLRQAVMENFVHDQLGASKQ